MDPEVKKQVAVAGASVRDLRKNHWKYFVRLRWTGYILSLLGLGFIVARWLPSANIFGIADQSLLPVFALILFFLGLTMAMAAGSLQVHIGYAELLRDVITVLLSLTEIVGATKESGKMTETRKQDQLDLETAIEKLERKIASTVKESEGRLRSEWRFVVTLVVAITLALIPIFLGMWWALNPAK